MIILYWNCTKWIAREWKFMREINILMGNVFYDHYYYYYAYYYYCWDDRLVLFIHFINYKFSILSKYYYYSQYYSHQHALIPKSVLFKQVYIINKITHSCVFSFNLNFDCLLNSHCYLFLMMTINHKFVIDWSYQSSNLYTFFYEFH